MEEEEVVEEVVDVTEDFIAEAEAKAVAKVLRKKECIKPINNDTAKNLGTNADPNNPKERKLPNIDIFVNPDKVEELTAIANKKRKIAKTYFEESKMATLFPELFRILWWSTLPCFEGDVIRKREIV